ncbi:MAG TPA: hypothetical protein PLO23_01020, partial [Alphaproteobacteria bacterium]|nr:hypothetical protein [Alphaproteobacteria bacterium]
NIIKSDPRSNLIHTMMLRLPEDVNDQIKSGEMNLRQVDLRQLRQNLPKFDLIVFDRYPNWNVIPAPYMKSIADYVKGGG